MSDEKFPIDDPHGFMRHELGIDGTEPVTSLDDARAEKMQKNAMGRAWLWFTSCATLTPEDPTFPQDMPALCLMTIADELQRHNRHMHRITQLLEDISKRD